MHFGFIACLSVYMYVLMLHHGTSIDEFGIAIIVYPFLIFTNSMLSILYIRCLVNILKRKHFSASVQYVHRDESQ
jgi:hypothetical protein